MFDEPIIGLPAGDMGERRDAKASVARQRVLVIEDELSARRFAQVCLRVLGYRVHVETSGAEAAVAVQWFQPDVVLMDIQLDGSMDGIEAAARIREHSDVPLVFVTACADRETLERSQNIQSSHYLVKPYDRKQLAATIHLALFRHMNRPVVSSGSGRTKPGEQRSSSVTDIGPMKIDLAQHRVFLHEKEIALTKKEFGILACLADRAGHLVTPSFLLSTVWGPRSEHYIQTLRVHIGNLRKRIALYSGVRIEAVRGAGYRLVEDSSPQDGCLHSMAHPVTPSRVAEN